jgi:hypothetical protein
MSQDPASDDVSARLYATVGRTLDHLEEQLRVVRARLDELPDGGFDEELARAAAALARGVKDLSGEMRQLEKHDRRMTLTPAQRFAELVRYVRRLPMEEFGAICDVIDDQRTPEQRLAAAVRFARALPGELFEQLGDVVNELREERAA